MRTIIIVSLLVLISLFVTYCYFENTIIETEKININNSKIPESFENYKIVQVSDLHNTRFGKNNKDLIAKIKDAQPNIIVITGDLIDSRRTNINIAIEFVKQAVEICPVYYTNGNHESRLNNYNELKAKLIDAGANVLENEKIEIENEGSNITLLGVNDPCFLSQDSIESAGVIEHEIRSIEYNKESFTILLSHRPELFDVYVNQNIDLVLTGHAHGGQFRLPIIGAIFVPNQGVFPKYTSGLYEKENTKMIVSRGLGNSIIPFRINNNPEIIVVTLNR